MKINIGISEKNVASVVSLLNKQLSNEYVLYTKTLNYHWNITSPSFMELHKFLDTQYQELQEIIDSVAERIRNLDGQTFGTLREFLKNTDLKEAPGKKLSATQMLKNLLNDHERVIVLLRKDVDLCEEKYKDKGTCDFLTGIMETHEKMAWILRSYLV